ncbi:hypothetical protein Y032_0030g2150 [Ancylostoma ceylanicum]|nr:hypothetical protein Y032_0030g2150 [Ancylostoma ceylanicum]
MLRFYLLILVALPLSTSLHQGRKKPPPDCAKSEQFPKGRADAFVNELNQRRRLMVEGLQKNGNTGKNLPTGENVAEVEWSCDLEKKAIDALNPCPTESPSAPNGTTGFFDNQDNGKNVDPMDLWLSEINNTSIVLHKHPEAPVRCNGTNRNYCNLVRYDVSRIGCAEKQCNGKTSTFCLVNMP